MRGRNIASLPEFEIDFSKGLLADAGVFAITGPTGAGKSSLLDALCLGLFDRAPRLESRLKGTKGSKVTRDTLSESDSRNCMRRKTSSAFAEVTFEGRHGHSFRAQWRVGRSYGRDDGALQKVSMALDDLTTGASLTSPGKEQTLASIEHALGLTYAQFCRAVLLAQGDFAQFLRSPAGEKAQLLEHLTGTGVFGAVSRAAYRFAKEKRSALAGLRERHGALAHATHDAVNESRARLTFQADEIARLQAERERVECALEESDALTRAHEESARVHAMRQGKEAERGALLRASLLREAAVQQATQALEAAQSGGEIAYARIAAARALDGKRRALQAARVGREALTARLRAAAGEAVARRTTLAPQAAMLAACPSSAPAATSFPAAPAAPADTHAVQWHAWCESTAAGWSGRAPFLHTARVVHRTKDWLDLIARVGDVEAKGRAERKTIAALLAQRGSARSGQVSAAALDPRDPHGARAALEAARDAREARLLALEAALKRAVDSAALTDERAELMNERTLDEERTVRLAELIATARLEATTLEADYHIALQAREIGARRAELLREGEPCPLCGSREHPLVHAGIASQNDQPTDPVSLQGDLASKLERARAAAVLALEKNSADHAATRSRFAESERRLARLNERLRTLATEAERAGIPLSRSAPELVSERDVLMQDRSETQLLLPAFTSLAELRVSYLELREAIAKAQTALETTRQEEISTCTRELEAITIAENQAKAELETLATQAFLESGELSQALAERTELALGDDLDAEEKNIRTALEKARKALDEARAAVAQGNATAARLEGEIRAADARLEDLAREIQTLSERVFGNAAAQNLTRPDTDFSNEPQPCFDDPLDADDVFETVETAVPEAPSLDAVRGHALDLRATLTAIRNALGEGAEALGRLREQERVLEAQARDRDSLGSEIQSATPRVDTWQKLSEFIGSADGDSFRRKAQALTLASLLESTNETLARLCPRYRLIASAAGEMDVLVSDLWMGEEPRGVGSLSGGETFLVSLALALGLCSLSAKHVFLGTLFIDEGFGTLDPATLETTLSMLDALQAEGRQVGLISHVPGLSERLAARIVVTPDGNGASRVSVEE